MELLNFDKNEPFSVKKNFEDVYLFSRVSCTDYVEIFFHLFNEDDSFPKELQIKNIRITDKNKSVLVSEEEFFEIAEYVTLANGYYQKVVWLKLDKVTYPPEEYQKKELKELTLTYEINGTKYEEKLVRADQHYSWIWKF